MDTPTNTTRPIPRGTRQQPARPVFAVVPVDNLDELTDLWINDQRVMELAMYFNSETTNLASSYNIRGLQPVIRKSPGSEFLLKDECDNFYRWDCENPGLYRLLEADDLASALDQIIYHPIMTEVEEMRNDLS